MSKLNYKRIVLGLGILGILALGLIMTPNSAAAYDEGVSRPYNQPNPGVLYNYQNPSINNNPGGYYPAPQYQPQAAYYNPPVVYVTAPSTTTKTTTSKSTTSKTSSNSSSNNSNNSVNEQDADASYTDKYSTLGASAVFGAGTFAPSGLVQWIFLAILILIIIILARRIFGATDRYHATPLKHS